jgi:hypothetical protein
MSSSTELQLHVALLLWFVLAAICPLLGVAAS